ncbi:MAG: hypothetical protein ACYC6Y_05845 [Thermoguttaceae bacterium]
MNLPTIRALPILAAVLATCPQMAPADDPTMVQGAAWPESSATSDDLAWSVDYRVRSMFDSSTSYQFGTPPGYVDGDFAPLSKLDFALDSTWHGLEVELRKPTWQIHFEWLTPVQPEVDGVLADYDWNIDFPQNDPQRLDSLTHSSQRWNDGQTLELGAEGLLTDHLFNLPIEVWPMAGFRFQRFDLTASNLSYLVPAAGPVAELDGVDVIAFNQQYYAGYFGGQIRVARFVGRTPIELAFEGDGGPAAGYNVDHHLLREGDRFTMERTHGAAWHVALIADAFLTRHLGAGIRADYLEIRTGGTHRLLNEPLDMDVTWDNGVLVNSSQFSLTAYLEARF